MKKTLSVILLASFVTLFMVSNGVAYESHRMMKKHSHKKMERMDQRHGKGYWPSHRPGKFPNPNRCVDWRYSLPPDPYCVAMDKAKNAPYPGQGWTPPNQDIRYPFVRKNKCGQPLYLQPDGTVGRGDRPGAIITQMGCGNIAILAQD